MTSAEIIKALRCCEFGVPCSRCPAVNNENCMNVMHERAADLIERLEKEKAALIEAANPRKLCEICKNDSYCFDARCDGNRCDDCYQYSDCPCADCLSYPKWEWKGLEGNDGLPR